MPNGVTPADPGFLASLADEIALPGYAIRNFYKGNIGGAGRNVADFLLNIVDAPVPGDVIPEQTREGERPEFKDIVPLDDGFVGSTVNFLGNVATDPLTFVPGTALAKGAGAVSKGVKAITPNVVKKGVSKAYEASKPALKKVRKTFGAEQISPEMKDVVTQSQAAKELVQSTAQGSFAQAMKDTLPRELEAVSEAIFKMSKDETGQLIDPEGVMSAQEHLLRVAGNYPELNPERLLTVLENLQKTTEGAWSAGKSQGIGGSIFRDMAGAPDTDIISGAIPGTTGSQGIRDYIPHQFKNEDSSEVLKELLSSPYPIKQRKLNTPRLVDEHLQNNEGVRLETHLPTIYQNYAGQLGSLAGRAATGKALLERVRQGSADFSEDFLRDKLPLAQGVAPVDDMLKGTARPTTVPGQHIPQSAPDTVMGGKPSEPVTKIPMTEAEKKISRDYILSKEFAQADPFMREAAEDIAKNLQGDERDVALFLLRGLEKRGAATEQLNKLNRYFKPYAVFGAIVPKLGSITRNLTGGLWQQFSNAEARGNVPQAAMRLIPNWLKSVDDGIEHLFGVRFSKNEFKEVDDAFRMSGGDPRVALANIKDPTMRAAVENGVFGNNFVDMEQLISSATKGGWKAFGKRLIDYPAAMFKGAEQRMRYGLYKDLLTKGANPRDASRIVRETFYDYTVSSAENRLARDIIPFFQFSAKAIPQQSKLMVEQPAVASAIGNLYAQGRDEPVSPYMEGKVNIPIGADEQGNQQYITNLGLPFEALGMIPNLSANPLQAGRDIEQNIVGSLQPALKTAYSYISGRDPYFGSPPGSYTKVAGQDLGAPGAVLNQLINSGLPFASAGQGLLSTAGKIADEKTSVPETLANLLTGARVTSVDPDRAIQQRIQSYLERRPDIGQYKVFYDRGDDVDAQQLLQNLRTAKQNLKEKQAALAPVE